ncbi:M20/M25/M40 family metallo-hydrolase [Polyangium jinanense]|uniref:M20/M25/M40 family metallo-hydrolase n=1 Tax=Polyangium jinanense TaxID=2829994 RepID=A0A9X3XFF7_9BACT|nr:M20/M25/M40 family metallo-hydrolase [Polyangium jinanense]MDC3959643.1 M20/M25/M40 family metallo-hydrolase [Polyangium jinanense]MDC3989429.1 M20/M25/M40 family metallo-hydrolase [Polyangium jinanense]
MELRRTKATSHGGSLIDALASMSEPELFKTVAELAEPRHMFVQRAQNRKAAQFIADAFEELGYAVELEGELRNVVAMPRGAVDRPLVLVGAHYDSVPDTPGADDNASGIAAMLACARALASLGTPLPVGFVAWNGEEDGLLGSIAFVARRQPAGASIAAVHVLEMVGYASHEAGSQRMPFPVPGAPDVGDFIGLLTNQRSNHLVELAAKQAEALVPELPVVGLKVYLGLEGWLPVLHRSDHSPFWKAKIPAMLWTDTAEFRNPNYHRLTDTWETLDYAFMRRVTQLLVATVARQVRTG